MVLNHLCVCVVCVDAVESVALLPVFYHSFRFVACIVWHVIPTSVLSHSQMSNCSCASEGGGGKEMQISTAMYLVTQFNLPHFHLIYK